MMLWRVNQLSVAVSRWTEAPRGSVAGWSHSFCMLAKCSQAIANGSGGFACISTFEITAARD